jgi:hypothetical protein
MSSPGRAAVFFLMVGCLSAGACGGTATSPDTAGNGIHVAGSYAITRSWVFMGCDPATPGATAPVTGTVAQSAGSPDFSLSNSDGGSFSGRVANDGTFTTGTVSSVGANGVSYNVLLAGTFTATGLTATLTGDQLRPTGTCREVIAWVGAKQGAPNVIP